MGVVTTLVAAPGGRFAVHLDGRLVCTASEALLARRGLVEGRELSDADLASLLSDAVEEALADARRLLEQRARSRHEIGARLLAKGHGEAAAAAAVARLTAVGLLDDADFARRYVGDKRALNDWGEVRIRRGLLELGVDVDGVAAALAASRDDDESNEADRALAVLRRKGAPRPPLEAARRRAYGTLLRRGFAAADAYAAVRAWTAEAQAADEQGRSPEGS
jgi:regulatory protein